MIITSQECRVRRHNKRSFQANAIEGSGENSKSLLLANDT